MTVAQVWNGSAWVPFTTAKRWDGDSWEVIEPFGEGGPPPGPTDDYEALVISDGPLAYWPMKEASGTDMLDASGNDRHGFYYDTPTLAASGPGGGAAVTFNGSSEYADAPFAPDFRTANFTAEAWVKTTDQDWQAIMAHPSGSGGPYGYSMFVEQTGSRLRGEIDTGSPSDRYSDHVLDDGQWHHVVFTDDGTDTRLYIDGWYERSDAEGGTLSYYTSSDNFTVGVMETHVPHQYFFQGSIAHAAVYDRALSHVEILEHYNTMNGEVPELLQRFTFPDGSLLGWAVGTGGEWSEDPADHVYAAGNGVGYTFIRRTQNPGATYFEVDIYVDDASSEWIALRPFDVNGATYDNGTPGYLVRGDGEVVAPWASGSDAGVGAGDLTSGYLVGSPVKTVGVYVPTPGTSECWVDGVLRKRRTGQTDYSANTYLTVGAYNGIDAHIKEVRVYSDKP